MDPKTHDKRVEMASLSDVSSTTTTATKSPGRARRVSMKIKKGLKEVKGMLSPHHHHHDRDQRRRKSGPNESPRGPLAPVLDHLERDKLVPIHLHISHTGSLTVSRKASSSSSRYSRSESTFEESKSETDVQPPQVTMPTPEPYVAPPSPQPPEYGEQEVPDPFLVDDPETPPSDPEPPAQEPAPSPPDSTPSESVALSPAVPEIVLPSENVPTPPPVEDKPIPAPPPPPPPVVSDTDSEPEAHTVYLPQLVLPTMFLPIPNVRISSHLTWWLTRRTSVYY
ncbi:hypothetical protein EDB83DRAFT_193718 [Lactarius deliciosus]|nr:hypothetical protein EDB83DRAFT_193718 [Lactarius deliciosus]